MAERPEGRSEDRGGDGLRAVPERGRGNAREGHDRRDHPRRLELLQASGRGLRPDPLPRKPPEPAQRRGQGRPPTDDRLALRRSGAGQGVSIPRTDQAAARDLRHPAQDPGLLGRLARDPEDALAPERDHPGERGQPADRPDKERPDVRSPAMSTGTVAAPTTAAPPRKKAPTDRARAERNLGWSLVAPAVVVMLLVTAYPIINACVLSLQRADLRFPAANTFIGFDNYGSVLGSSLWWDDVFHTLLITVVTVSVEL